MLGTGQSVYMKIGIVGHGVVGSAMARFFSRQPRHEVFIYDKFHPPHNSAECKLLINSTDLVFVSVPTPAAPGSLACDMSRTAELCKYMEKSYLAMKVAFMNQFYDIASAFDVDFDCLREVWLAGPRIGTSHTWVTEERGFRGRCLPKDVSALISAMMEKGGAPLLEAVLEYNTDLCRQADRTRSLAAANV